MVGQVPSPTPMVGTSGDSTRVIFRSRPCSAARMPAVSQPAEPPPRIRMCLTGLIIDVVYGKNVAYRKKVPGFP